MEQSPAGRGSKQPQNKEDVAKIDTPVPAPQIRRQRRNAFGACSAPVPRPDDSQGSPAAPVAYPPVRPATPGTSRTAHIAARGSARSQRLSSGSSPGQAVTPLRRVSSPPTVGRSTSSPLQRRSAGPVGVQLPYAYGQLNAATEPFPVFVDTEIPAPKAPELSTNQWTFENAEGQSGANAGSPTNRASRNRGATLRPAPIEAAISTQQGSQAPSHCQRAASRTVLRNTPPSGHLPPDTNPAPPRQ